MHNDDYTEFCELLDGAYDLIGSGANKIISGGAKGLFFNAMGAYSLQTVRAALGAHCMDKVRGRFTPKPADLIEQIESAAANDGRPGAEEAWAIALTSRDEADTVVWTQEIAEAFVLCQPVLDMSDEVGARMAFKEAYARITAKARNENRPAQWSASLGWDAAKREVALQKAAVAGLMAAPVVAGLLPPPDGQGADAKAHSQIAKIKEMMASMNGQRQQEGESWAQQQCNATADAKAAANAMVSEYQGCRT